MQLIIKLILKNVLIIFLGASLFSVSSCQVENNENQTKIMSMEIDKVWSGHPVGFAMITHPPHQFIAYYDSNRVMTVAQRKLNEQTWVKTKLPETVGWDSHNSIRMTLDSKGAIHVSGNMHVVDLVYFQSEKPYDASSLKRKTPLVGDMENLATYPQFFDAPNGDLIFTYRHGSSSKGNQIYNRYDVENGEWSRLIDGALIDGEGKSNAYIHGPILGPDGYFHMIWVWRLELDANANCNISYVRTKDLQHWERSDGTEQVISIKIDNCEVIDPIPIYHGLLNGNTKIGFDSQKRVIVSYHKYDEEGNIQIYNARREQDGWKIYQATDWNWRWDFGGWGSIITRVGLSEVELQNNQLTQTYFIDTIGHQKFIVNEDNLRAVSKIEEKEAYPDSLKIPSGNLENGQVHLISNEMEDGSLYLLKWETLERNRDKPRPGPHPAPQSLVLYQIENK